LSNASGNYNVASGAGSLFNNTSGTSNIAIGNGALYRNNTGTGNTALGFHALFSNTGGVNTAVGNQALSNNTSGLGNTAIGYHAGSNVSTANNVVCIDSPGGNVTNSICVNHIYGVITQSGATLPVAVSNTGQLGTSSSSARFKKEIKPMNKASETILALKPVAFRYKTDTTNTPQFGLVAEDVAKINPDLVVRDNKGEIYTVRYDAVNAMVLNEFLKEHRKVQKLEASLEAAEARLKEQDAKIQRVNDRLQLRKPDPQIVANDR